MTPNWNEMAAAPLPEGEQSSERLDVICDQITALLYRAHDLAARIDPELGDYFVETMTRAFGGQR